MLTAPSPAPPPPPTAPHQAPNPQPIAIPFPQAIQSLEPTKLKPPARVTAIAAGGDHSMAVTVGGTLLAFGCNKHGQLGTGDTFDRMIPTEVPLTLDSEAGQLVRAMQVQCGSMHTLALVQNGGHHEVRSSGDNSYGQLGLGDRRDRQRFHPITPLTVSRICGRATGRRCWLLVGQSAVGAAPRFAAQRCP